MENNIETIIYSNMSLNSNNLVLSYLIFYHVKNVIYYLQETEQ
jgi:hypothetical protein